MSDLSSRPPPTLRQSLFARFWGWAAAPVDRTLSATKRALFVDIANQIVELGPGVGSNFKYYPPGATVHAFEPNPAMHAKLRASAADSDLELELTTLDLREAGLPSLTYDAVVCTLVLCSADEPATLVSEVRRILRPGGAFLFLEHVAPQPGTAAETIARTIRRPWACLADNCNVMAATVDFIESADFSSIDATVESFGGRFDPSADHYWGVAVK